MHAHRATHRLRARRGYVVVEFAIAILPYTLLCCLIVAMGLLGEARVQAEIATRNTSWRGGRDKSFLDSSQENKQAYAQEDLYAPNVEFDSLSLGTVAGSSESDAAVSEEASGNSEDLSANVMDMAFDATDWIMEFIDQGATETNMRLEVTPLYGQNFLGTYHMRARHRVSLDTWGVRSPPVFSNRQNDWFEALASGLRDLFTF